MQWQEKTSFHGLFLIFNRSLLNVLSVKLCTASVEHGSVAQISHTCPLQLFSLFHKSVTFPFLPPSRSLLSGYRMPERVCDFQGQSFHKLRRDCLRRGALFKDPLFPTTAQSLFYKREPPPGLTWKRPRVSVRCVGWRMEEIQITTESF